VQRRYIQPAGLGYIQHHTGPGTYVLDLSRFSGMGAAGRLPAALSIGAGKTMIMDLDIDTKIR